jgi:hypothetical protein
MVTACWHGGGILRIITVLRTQRFKFLFLTNKKFIFICFGRDIIKKKKSNKSEVCWEVDSGLARG